MQKIFLLIFYSSFVTEASSSLWLNLNAWLGERDLSYLRHQSFMHSEILLFTACYSAFKISDLIEHKYISMPNCMLEQVPQLTMNTGRILVIIILIMILIPNI